MLEKVAKTKLCPFKMNAVVLTSTTCVGSSCMAWEVWSDPIRDEMGTITDHKTKEPPEGHCGMIPPELNCRF